MSGTKKLMILAAVAAAAVSITWAENAPAPKPAPFRWPETAVFARAGSFSPGADIFKTVYGSGFTAGGEIRIRLARRLSMSLEVQPFKKTGKMTVTDEPTKIKTTPISALATYHFLSGRFQPYAGAGICLLSYREDNHLGSADGSGFGFAASVGVTARWKFLGVDARVKYFSVKAKTETEKVDFGGLVFDLGVGVFF